MGMFVIFTEDCPKDNLFISLYEQFSAIFFFCLKTVGGKTFPLVTVYSSGVRLVSEFSYTFHSSFGLMLDCHSGILLFLPLFCLSSRPVFHSEMYVSEQKSSCEVAQWCPTLCDPMGCRLLCPWDFSRQVYWSGLPFPSPEIQLHHLLSQKYLRVSFHFSRINSKRGRSAA